CGGAVDPRVIGADRVHGDVRHDALVRRYHPGLVGPVIQAVDDLVLVVGQALQVLVPAQRAYGARAAHREEIPHRARVDVRVTAHEVERGAQRVERYAVAHAVDLHVVPAAGRGDVLRRQHVVPIEQVGVEVAQVQALVAGLRRAGVVERYARLPRL